MTNNLPDAEAALLAGSLEAAANTNIPKENQTEFCLSCGAATPQRYCGECGLKNDDLRRSLFKLVTETLGGIFAFEGRMWRTWAALLFKPGKVAREYADGRRTTYSAPIRVYLVMTFLMLTYLAVTQTNLFAVAVSEKPPEQIAAELEAEKTELALQKEKADIETAKDEIVQEIKDGLSDIPNSNIEEKSDQLEEDKIVGNIGNIEFDFDLKKHNFEFLFFQPQSKFEEIMDRSSAEGFVNAMNAAEKELQINADGKNIDGRKAFEVFLTNPIRFNQQFNTWLPRAMFFMVPMVMFLGVIYIRGPNALLYDHLIHAIYIHSIFFMALLVSILLSKVFSGGTVAKILFISLLIYLPLSLKRMFGRGWIKTIWTTVNIGFIYITVLTIVMMMISVYAMTQLST